MCVKLSRPPTRRMTVLGETLQFVVGTVLFARSLIQAVYQNYIKTYDHVKKDDDSAQRIKGKGLSKEFPEKLPSIVEIKRVIPRHCFDPKVSTSMYYVVKDFGMIAVAFAAILYIHSYPSTLLWWVSTLLYWGIQGTFFTAIFVIGHDCGHGSFSKHHWLNDVIGTLCHGFLCAPYYPWKLTHRIHHKNTANIDKDEVFYPPKESEIGTAKSVQIPGFGFGVGWFVYIITGYKPRQISHFNFRHAAFAGHVLGCLVSVGAMATVGYTCYRFAEYYSWLDVAVYYGVPVFVFGSYCVVITFLHHNEINVPWYSNDNWDFVKGQLSSIDRNYGYVHYIIHSIGTHQMHHMFTKIPHYHLEEATSYFRAHFPDLVRTCDEPIIPSFLRMYRKYETQACVPDDATVHYYK